MKKHGLVLLLSAFSIAALSGCSGVQSHATCFDCTTTPQKWSQFGFHSLEGTWRGVQDISINEADAEKLVTDKKNIEVTFLEGHKFLNAYRIADGACAGFPNEAVVLTTELWWDRSSAKPKNQRAFEVFGKIETDHVSYGRVLITQTEKGNSCEYSANEKAITMNRLSLPAVALSRRLTSDGRALASGSTKEVDINFEFLNYDNARVSSEYRYTGKQKEAPLFFRFVKTTREVQGAFDEGEWRGTEEKIFRLWRVN